jgi:hypothetical protein
MEEEEEEEEEENDISWNTKEKRQENASRDVVTSTQYGQGWTVSGPIWRESNN